MPRRLAQRPLPSMMMPTWVGTVSGSDSEAACVVDSGWAPATIDTQLDLHDFGFFMPRNVLDAFDETVGELLQPLLSAFFVLLRDAAILFRLAQVIECVAAAIG